MYVYISNRLMVESRCTLCFHCSVCVCVCVGCDFPNECWCSFWYRPHWAIEEMETKKEKVCSLMQRVYFVTIMLRFRFFFHLVKWVFICDYAILLLVFWYISVGFLCECFCSFPKHFLFAYLSLSQSVSRFFFIDSFLYFAVLFYGYEFQYIPLKIAIYSSFFSGWCLTMTILLVMWFYCILYRVFKV